MPAYCAAIAELGPSLSPRTVLWAKAREVKLLAERAMEFAGTGPTADLALAERQIEAMRAVLGCGE